MKTKSGSFLLAIPKNWALRMNLKGGDQVVVEELDDDTLLIKARVEAEEGEKLSETIIEYSNTIERDLLGRYLIGHDIIKVTSKSKLTLEQKERIKKAIVSLIGVEVIEERANEITLQCLLSPLAVPLRSLFKRANVIAQQMHGDSIKALIERDVELAQSVMKRDEDLNRIYFLMVRQLRTIIRNPKLAEKAGIKLYECLDYRLAAKSIESIGDEAVSIAKSTIRLLPCDTKLGIEQEIVELSNLVDRMHNDAFNAFMKSDYDLSVQVIELSSRMRSMADELNIKALKLPPTMAFNVSSVITSLRIIGEISVDIADLVIKP
ncbi:MAG: PhoU domain-containing protein [Candidatus Nezhaarchaeota archaeon]|nr:PhoU domain-containing protein [Candidatus Nezhaarchaeota archaeon]